MGGGSYKEKHLRIVREEVILTLGAGGPWSSRYVDSPEMEHMRQDYFKIHLH